MSDQKSQGILSSTENELHDIQDLHERDIIPEIKQVDLSSVVIESEISKLPPAQQAAAIVKEFNKLVKEDERAITTTINPCRGDRIDRGQFLLAHRNFVPEIHPYSQNKLSTVWSWYLPNTIIEKISVVPQTDSFGAHGTYCINVPLGKYCKVWYGNIPKLLGPGYHVVHDTTFRYDTAHVDISSQLIQHGTIHILRIPVGKIAKCWWGPTPNLLYARGDGSPYVINDPIFKLDSFVDQNDNYIGHGTIHILRVDAGKFAKIWIGNQAQLLPSRKDAYVFHSPYFRFNPSDVCSQMDRVINHGVITVLRIPAGYAMKCWIGTEPKILDSRPDPYRWEDPLFRLDSMQLFNQLNPYIKHGNIHRLRIPAGKLAKVWEGTTAKIMESRIETYEFVSPYFRVQPVKNGAIIDDEKRGVEISTNADDLFEDAFNPYIAHGPIHLIRVPSGKVARVWDGSKAMLLEYSPDIYRFESPYFRLERTASGDLFEEATSQCIIHGALKRIMPRTGEIGISYENGKLIIRDPPKDTSKPLLIDSATCSFDGFLSVGVQTLVFPSEEMKVQRRAEKMSEDEVNYEVFTTRDSLRIGVKLLVAFRIVNPVLALTLLGKDGIIRHVENCATVDMGKAIQMCTSKDFLSSTQSSRNRRVPQGAAQASGNGFIDPVDDKDPGSSQTILQKFQENVKDALSHDLSEYGIELVRLNFETPKILNKEIAKQLEDQAVQVAKITANESVLEQQYKIAEVQAKQQAEVARIQQERENANKRAVTETENANRIANAEAEKQSAQLRADALLIENETRLKIQRTQGQQFDEHPGLLQLELAKIQAQAWQAAKISMLVSPDEMGKLFSGMNSLPFLQQMMAQQNK